MARTRRTVPRSTPIVPTAPVTGSMGGGTSTGQSSRVPRTPTAPVGGNTISMGRTQNRSRLNRRVAQGIVTPGVRKKK